MKKTIIAMFTIGLVLTSCKNETKTDTAKAEDQKQELTDEALEIIPISHATMVLNYKNETLYIDPTGGNDAFKNQKAPTIIVITDIHGDHMNIKTLEALDLSKTTLIAPKAVMEKLSAIPVKTNVTLNNGDTFSYNGLSFEAIPMYNLREEALKFHPKGRGNGYVITFGEERVYISGDTEDIPEMRALKNIDKAFVCMNLPYTMTVKSAASAVLEFKPKQIYPYHYRGTGGLSDVDNFKSIINTGNSDIKVIQLNWYPN